MNLNPLTKVAARWGELTPGKQQFAVALGGAALAGTGTYVAGRRDSAIAQSVAYTSVFSLLGSAGVALAGAAVARSVRGSVGRQVTAGLLDAVAGQAKIAEAGKRAMRPAKLMFYSSVFVGTGVVAGNSVIQRTQLDTINRVTEAQNQTQRAHKVGSKK